MQKTIVVYLELFGQSCQLKYTTFLPFVMSGIFYKGEIGNIGGKNELL